MRKPRSARSHVNVYLENALLDEVERQAEAARPRLTRDKHLNALLREALNKPQPLKVRPVSADVTHAVLQALGLGPPTAED